MRLLPGKSLALRWLYPQFLADVTPATARTLDPGGLFMFCGQTLTDDLGSTSKGNQVGRHFAQSRTALRHASVGATSYVLTHPRLPLCRSGSEKEHRLLFLLLLLLLVFFFLSLSVPLLFAPCRFVYAACSRARKHRSDKVSPCVRMKDRARQTEGKGK